MVSQLVACKIGQGLLIAADRRVEARQPEGTRVHLLRKLHPLGPAAALVSGGAAMGIEVTRTLSHMLLGRRRETALVFEELEPYVLSVFQEKYDAFVKEGAKWFADHPDAPRRCCFLLGARSLDGSYQMGFYSSEEHNQPFRRSPIGAVIAMPRRLGLETHLSRAAALEHPISDTRDTLIDALRKIATTDEAVGGPFDIATFGPSSVELETVDP